jgi:hypothetical protein
LKNIKLAWEMKPAPAIPEEAKKIGDYDDAFGSPLE